MPPPRRRGEPTPEEMRDAADLGPSEEEMRRAAGLDAGRLPLIPTRRGGMPVSVAPVLRGDPQFEVIPVQERGSPPEIRPRLTDDRRSPESSTRPRLVDDRPGAVTVTRSPGGSVGFSGPDAEASFLAETMAQGRPPDASMYPPLPPRDGITVTPLGPPEHMPPGSPDGMVATPLGPPQPAAPPTRPGMSDEEIDAMMRDVEAQWDAESSARSDSATAQLEAQMRSLGQLEPGASAGDWLAGLPGALRDPERQALLAEAGDANAQMRASVERRRREALLADAADANRQMRESVERRRAERGVAGVPAASPRRGGGGRVTTVGAEGASPEDQALIDEGQLADAIAYDRRPEDPLARARGLIDDRRRLEQQRATAEGGYASDVRGILEGDRERQAATEQLRQRAAADARGAYQRALDRIDRRAFFTEAGPGGQIGSILAVAMGAIGAEITGGPNMALDLIERQIDQFLDNARTRADGAGQMVGMVDREFENRSAADSALRASLLEEAQAELAQQTAGLQSQEAQIRAQELMMQLEQQRAAAQAQALRDEMTHRAETYRTMMQGRRYAAQAADQERRTAMRGMGGRAGPPISSQEREAIGFWLDRGLATDAVAQAIGRPDLAPLIGQTGVAQSAESRAAAGEAATLAAGILEDYPEGTDIPGVGPLDQLTPDWLLGITSELGLGGDESLSVRQRADMLLLAFQRSVTGRAATDAERATIRQALMRSRTDGDLRRASTMILDLVQAGQAGATRSVETARTRGSRRRGEDIGFVGD